MKFLAPLIIVLLIIVSVVLGYGIYKQKSFNDAISQPVNQNLCSQFTEIQGEINCQQAISVTQGKYPGEVLSVKKQDSLATRLGPKNIWKIGVKLNTPVSVAGGKEPFDFIDVATDRADGKILFFAKSSLIVE